MAFVNMPLRATGPSSVNILEQLRAGYFDRDIANRNANIARANAAQQYWDQGEESNAAIARAEQDRNLNLALMLADRAANKSLAQQELQRREYEFGKQLDYNRSRDLTRDALNERMLKQQETISGLQTQQQQAAEYFAGLADDITQGRRRLKDARPEELAGMTPIMLSRLKAADDEVSRTVTGRSATANAVNNAILNKRIDRTLAQLPEYRNLMPGDPKYAEARRKVAAQSPDSWAKIGESDLKDIANEFKAMGGIDGFVFDRLRQTLIPTSQADESYWKTEVDLGPGSTTTAPPKYEGGFFKSVVKPIGMNMLFGGLPVGSVMNAADRYFPDAPAPQASSTTVIIKLSDGRVMQFPKANVAAVKQRDPRAIVIQ